MADSSDLVASKIEAKRKKLEEKLARKRAGLDSGDLTSSASSDTTSSSDTTDAPPDAAVATPPPATPGPAPTNGAALSESAKLSASAKLAAPPAKPAEAPKPAAPRAESGKLPSPLPAAPGDKLAASSKLTAPGKGGPGDKLSESTKPAKQPVHLAPPTAAAPPTAPASTVAAAPKPAIPAAPPAPESDPKQTMGAVLIGVGILLCVGLLMIVTNRPATTPPTDTTPLVTEAPTVTEPPRVTEAPPPVVATEAPVATQTPAVTETPPATPTETPVVVTPTEAPPPETPPPGFTDHMNAAPGRITAEPTRAGIVVSWDATAEVDGVVRSFEVLRQAGEGEWERVHASEAVVSSFVDASAQRQRVDYRYKVAALAQVDPEHPVVKRFCLMIPDEQARLESEPTPPVRALPNTYVIPTTINFADAPPGTAPEDLQAIVFLRVHRWDPETNAWVKHAFTVNEGAPIGGPAKLRGGRSFDFTVGAVLEDARVETRKNEKHGHDEQVQVIRLRYEDGTTVEWNDKDVPAELGAN